MIKCSHCEQPLACKSCHKLFHPRRSETHVGVYDPALEVDCPECGKVLICRACGFVYGEQSVDDDLNT
jgi:hypothetical protein